MKVKLALETLIYQNVFVTWLHILLPWNSERENYRMFAVSFLYMNIQKYRYCHRLLWTISEEHKYHLLPIIEIDSWY